MIHFPADVQGWLTVGEGTTLAKWCEGKHVLEIGCYKGRSTICIAQVAKSVTCVDPFDAVAGVGTEDKFIKNLNRYNIRNVNYHEMTSKQFIPLVEPEYDIVFIDGDHTYEAVKLDINLALKAFKTFPANIIFHDYRVGTWNHGCDPGVEQACEELLAKDWAKKVEHTEAVLVVEVTERNEL